ncbi:sensor histidine kinase [Tannerella forsythia]|uniref:histidine kinase n=1 Tax=Tannerella forsythia TaxID=28112 RepID=A0A3P1XW97_TANFO|nr:HAMP domain-containing sensor histidine kinase [Tannerella forsythia]RRD62236.1 sensor histidine kinase [Tannerella forsythia]
MNTRNPKIVTAASLLVLLSLQTVWSVYTYRMQYNRLEEKYNEVFAASTFRDIMKRTKGTIPEGTEIVGGGVQEDGKEDFTPFQEILLKYNAPISLTQFDSIYQTFLIAENIHTKTIIDKINLRTGEVLESTDPTFRAWWGTVETEPALLRRDSTEALRAVIVSPHRNVLNRLGLLLFGSLISMIFIVWGIAYQIKIIITQNRIAQLRRTFSNAMVHDMKTPLNTILMGTRILSSGKIDHDTEKKKKHFDIIEDKCHHLLSLSDKVLTLAKIEEDKLILDRTEVPLKPMIEELARNLSIRTDKQITFEMHCPETEQVYADPVHLREIISNLIDNAVKYSGDSVHIDLSCRTTPNETRISVSDNGFGIPLKDQALIFEKFERASAANKRSLRGGATGFGLGLTYVQQVMQAHGGSVEVESIEGQGSEFTLIFPLLMQEISFQLTPETA